MFILEESMYCLGILIIRRVLFGFVFHSRAGNFFKNAPFINSIFRKSYVCGYLDTSAEPVVYDDRIAGGQIRTGFVHCDPVCRVAHIRIGVFRDLRTALFARRSRRFKILCAAEILRLNYVIKINIRIVRHTYGAAEKNSFRHTVISGSSGIQDLKRVVLQLCRRCHFLCDRYCECCHIRGSGSRDIAVELI